jgi:hypothetical protein
MENAHKGASSVVLSSMELASSFTRGTELFPEVYVLQTVCSEEYLQQDK